MKLSDNYESMKYCCLIKVFVAFAYILQSCFMKKLPILQIFIDMTLHSADMEMSDLLGKRFVAGKK